MTPSTSHDPKTDHRSLYILIGIAIIGMVGICAAVAPSGKPKDFEKVAEVDGCTVFQFEKSGDTHFFVRCPSDTTAVTHADGTTAVTVVE